MALTAGNCQNQANSTAGTSCTVTAPGGISDDDILIYALDRAVASDSITWPSGFTQLWATTYAGGSMSCAWKRASSESGNYQASWSTSSRNVGIVFERQDPVAVNRLLNHA